jgi:rare lipoprotein A
LGASFGRAIFGAFAYLAAAGMVGACTVSRANAPAFATSTGTASYYADRFAGQRTASGEAYDPADFTAAHRNLPFGTRVRVTNMANGESVVVRINDRGPWGGGRRLIDVSRAAARELGLIRSGHGQVTLSPAGEASEDSDKD